MLSKLSDLGIPDPVSLAEITDFVDRMIPVLEKSGDAGKLIAVYLRQSRTASKALLDQSRKMSLERGRD